MCTNISVTKHERCIRRNPFVLFEILLIDIESKFTTVSTYF